MSEIDANLFKDTKQNKKKTEEGNLLDNVNRFVRCIKHVKMKQQ